MSSFDDLFPDDELVDVLGDDIIYKRGGKRIPLKAFIDKTAERYGNDGVIVGLGVNIEILKSQLYLYPERGDVIFEGKVQYTVDAITKDDGAYVTVAVHK